jgi:branched-chain amino acid transport system ATP-binding protein
MTAFMQEVSVNRPILETLNLHVDFGGVRAVDGINFRVEGREIHAVIGPNGAGKTTFFNALSGVVRPSSGQVRFEGIDITGKSPRRIARLRLVRTFQVTSLFPGLRVRDNIWIAAQARLGMLSAVWRSASRATVDEKTAEIIELLGLGSVADTKVADLSYGDQRVVEVALALALSPKLLLLDEPTAGMSPHETGRIAQLVRRIRDLVSIVIIEHDMEVVMGIADTISVFNFGRVVAQGPPLAIAKDPQVRELYLGNFSC